MNILWGPLLFAWDGAPENQVFGWVAVALIFGAVVPFLVYRKAWSGALAILGIVAWLLLGIVGSGINV